MDPNSKQTKPGEPSLQQRMEACSKELAELLAKHGAVLVAVPAFKPDGRNGWFIDCAIQLLPRGA